MLTVWLSKIFHGILKTSQLFTDTAEVKASNFQLLLCWGFCRKLSSELTGKRASGGRADVQYRATRAQTPVTSPLQQSHPKVASFTQKLPVSSKCCWCQPENAGFTKKLPVLHKSSCLPSEKISASPSTKSNWFHLKIDVLNQKLVSPKSSWCDLKVATSTQSCRVQPKVAGCHTDLKVLL